MVTKIKDTATAEKAALKLNTGVETAEKPSEPAAPKEKTTTEKLFPEFMTEDGGIINRPVKPFTDASKPLPATATPEAPAQGPSPAAQTPPLPVYLKPEELTGKMVRLKVDGVEQDVPADTLIKTTQLERHLNAQLMNLAQERKALEEDRRKLLANPPPVPEDKKPGKAPEAVKKTPEMEAVEAKYLELQQQMATLQETMRPAIQESGIKRVEQMVKTQLGAEDFRSYFEKIRETALEQAAKPEVANDPNALRYFDSDAYYFEKYKELKLRELLSKNSATAPVVNPNVPALVTQEGDPVVINTSGKPVSIPSFEPSGGVPSKVGTEASWQSTYNALFARAKETNSQEDWMAFFRHKVRSGE